MYGLVFYLNKDKLKEEYSHNENYKQAYEDVRDILRHYGFHWLSNSFYFSRSIDNLRQIFRAIEHLKKVKWFVKSLVSIHVFKMEDLSNFTEELMGEAASIEDEE
ncbi:virulence protein [Metamycoplasma equirhinis]|uniref:virulence protein n=1 Tax=Metamycoplasma equirhinis TaxID=92402 RepID=UPI0035941900